MDIISMYHEHFSGSTVNAHDLNLIQYTEKLFVGTDDVGHTVVVCISNKPNRVPLKQKTKMLSVECNVRVKYLINGVIEENTVHIIRCFSNSQKEKDIFLELCPLFVEASKQDDQEEAILEAVSILSAFFANTIEPSDNELQGLYAELFTIWSYKDKCNLGRYWQSEDRMKFDFSISDVMKLEVKSTLKNERKHHFRHEQLLNEVYDIFIVSYMLRHDDEGLSLSDLINQTKPLIQDDPRKILIIDRYTKNTSESRLKEFRFNEYITLAKRKVFIADDVPKFEEQTPTGVTNAEYDCNLDTVQDIQESVFLDEITRVISAK